MSSPLDLLIADGVIDEVMGRLKSGKEADISLVRRGEAVLAAKVYKDRSTRSFKNNADYKEGRKVRNTRTQRAMDSGGKFGRDAAEQEWKSAEADALYKLAGSGVRIPAPVMFYEGVLLMELVRGADGGPAPRLIELALEPIAALRIYADLCAQIISMLCCDLIHGDLSPYNILAAADGPTIIDFPQVVSAVHSSRAEWFFLRDFDNVVTFLAGFDPSLAIHAADGRAIWRAYVSRELTPEFVPPPPQRAPSQRRGRGRGREGSPAHGGGDTRGQGAPSSNGGGPPRRDGEARWQGSPRPNGGGGPPGRNGDGQAQGSPRPNGGGGGPPGRDAGGRQGAPANNSNRRWQGGGPSRNGDTRDQAARSNAGGGPPRNGDARWQGSSNGGGGPPRNGDARGQGSANGGGGSPRNGDARGQGSSNGRGGPPRNGDIRGQGSSSGGGGPPRNGDMRGQGSSNGRGGPPRNGDARWQGQGSSNGGGPPRNGDPRGQAQPNGGGRPPEPGGDPQWSASSPTRDDQRPQAPRGASGERRPPPVRSGWSEARPAAFTPPPRPTGRRRPKRRF